MIELRDVSFSYEGRGGIRALEQVSLQVAPGETVALVGPTGAGKSTIAQLVARLVDPTEGSVCNKSLPLRPIRARVSEAQVRT